MRLQNDEAWVLRTLELGETDLIVHLFCREHGGVRGVARSARKSRRRFGGVLEPMTRVRVSWAERSGRDLHRIESIDCAKSYAEMQREPAVQAAIAVLAELTDLFARDGEPELRSFRLIAAVSDALEAGCDPWIAVRYFEYWMLRIHGLLPDVEQCAACGRAVGTRPAPTVDRNGILRCRVCAATAEAGGRMLAGADRAFLEQMRVKAPLEVGADRRRAAPGSAVASLLRGSLEGFLERRLRSYRHLDLLTREPRGGNGGER